MMIKINKFWDEVNFGTFINIKHETFITRRDLHETE
jgi:hypothetical protein